MHNNSLLTVEQREAFFTALYRSAFTPLARYMARMDGSLEEAQDVFQDALVIYYEKVTSAEAGAIVNEKAYLLGIAKNLWLQHYKDGSITQPFKNTDVEETTEEQPATHKLLHYLETAGKNCMELLKAHYYDHLSVGAIAERFGYAGTRSATVAKYKCLEKVRETVKQKSLSYADFVE